MSEATPNFKVTIDNITVEVAPGTTILNAARMIGGDVTPPAMCYYSKLKESGGKCRTCLVEVSKGSEKDPRPMPKLVPSCRTTVMDGMEVKNITSPKVLDARKGVVEFLLVNHPLDCPICDQGGECELQDISMGFGKDESNYTETKRAVSDDDLGDLIATEMTRCIQCTRCVRFCDEIAGLPELGGIGRGEKMQISTYVQHNMQSEVSGNIIDLCPVGALTSKPYRFTARPWEMVEFASIAPHDCLGSNVFLHTRRDKVMRVVPKENDDINETWLSDRDRFSYLGLNSSNRLADPLIKTNGKWEKTNWQNALEFVASGITKILKKHGPKQFAAFSSPSATTEEAYLLQKMMRTFGIENLDSRLHQSDFRRCV
ncbi:MAG: NADH dehydrogenase (quinone) subunit G [Chitinophagia bacterium]|nr:NADH dehydrogenase (quinone) subunit G [Chitinophagia bacterium]